MAGSIAALAAIACRGEVPAPTPSPAVTPITAEGIARTVREAHGSVVLVNVWATWCDPCRREFPALLAVAREFARSRFKLFLVSADFPEERAKVLAFLAERGVAFPSYLKEQDDMTFINTLDPRWSGALPATFLYARDGTLCDFWEGEASQETLTRKVRALLGSAPGRDAEGGTR